MTYAVLDVETTGLSIFKGAEPFLFGLRMNGKDQITRCPEEISEALEDATIDKVGHGIKFDILMMTTVGQKVFGKLWDTMLMLFLLESHLPASLLKGTKRWVPEHVKLVDDIEEWFKFNGIKKADKRYDELPSELIEPYLVGDLDSTEALFLKLYDEIVKRGLLPLLEQECELIYVLVHMHLLGIKIDVDYLLDLSETYAGRISELETKIYKSAGCEFNIMSARGLAKILIKAGASLPLTEKGNYSCSEDSLELVEHPLAKLVVKYRHQKKFYSTYIIGLLREQVYDFIHCDLLQHGAITGRFSSREPNLQNIPRDDKDIRRAFIPRSKDFNLFFIDYKQMEYRVFLDYIGEEELIRQINEHDADFHTLIGAMLKPYLEISFLNRTDLISAKGNKESLIEYKFNGEFKSKTLKEFIGTDEEALDIVFNNECRNIAKTFNFAMIYGAGIAKIASMLHLSYELAKQLKEIYFQKLPKVKPFLDKIKETIWFRTVNSPYVGRGYIKNKYGRMSWLFVDEAYKAPNYLIQGTCADMVKAKMIEVYKFLKPYKSNLLLQIHDELIFEIHKDEHHLVPELKRIMEDFKHLFKVNIGVDVSWSKDNWANKEDWVA